MDSTQRETIHVGAVQVKFLVDADESGGSVTVFECTVPVGAKVPAPHSHDAFEETIYGIEGICTWMVDGEQHDLRPHDALCIRRGQVHGFANDGTIDVKFLAIASPGVFGPAYFHDVAAVIASAAGGPPDLEAVGAAMRRHGLSPAKPVAV
jgi:quercetin dioxygenase-like cupin family protein